MKAIRNVTLLSLSLIALTLFAVAPAAYADPQIIQTVTLPNHGDNLAGELFVPVLAQFNNTSGPYTGDTLQWVEIIFTGSGHTTLTALNTDLNNASTGVGVNSTTTVTLNSTIVALNSILVSNNFKDAMSASVSGLTVAPNSTYNSGDLTMVSGGGKTMTFNSGLGTFIGTGDLGFELNSNTFVSSGGTGGSLTAGQTGNGSGGTVEVIYDYTLYQPPTGTPEPGTLTLFGTGLIGLAGMLRRKYMHSR
jgi:hypothetical protein